MPKAEEASQPVSDDELDRAADEAVVVPEVVEEEVSEEVAEEATETEGVVEVETEEVIEEEVVDPEVPAEPEDNAERSRLGRKVQELETQLNTERAENKQQLNDVLLRVDKLLNRDQEVEEVDDFVMPETKSELSAIISKAMEDRESSSKKAETVKASEYQTDYVDAVLDLVDDETEEVRAEILKRLGTDDYNKKYSDKGARDAAKNVKNVIKSLAVKGKAIPLKGEKPRAPLGGGGKDKIPGKVLKMPKLDADAKAFMDATGMSEEDVAATLDGDAPAYIRN